MKSSEYLIQFLSQTKRLSHKISYHKQLKGWIPIENHSFEISQNHFAPAQKILSN